MLSLQSRHGARHDRKSDRASASVTIDRMYPWVRRVLPLFCRLNHVHGRCVSPLLARPAFQRRLQPGLDQAADSFGPRHSPSCMSIHASIASICRIPRRRRTATSTVLLLSLRRDRECWGRLQLIGYQLVGIAKTAIVGRQYREGGFRNLRL